MLLILIQSFALFASSGVYCERDKRDFGGGFVSVKVTPLSQGQFTIEWRGDRESDLIATLPCQWRAPHFVNCEKEGSPIASRKSLFFSRVKTSEFIPSPLNNEVAEVQSIEFYLRLPSRQHQTAYIERRYEFPIHLCSAP